MDAPKTIRLRIKRQDGPGTEPYWEEFEVPYRPKQNVLSLLQDIRLNPTNCEGKCSKPVAYEAACVEEVCGSCTMLINGKVRQGCSALVDPILEASGPVITLEPLKKFPVVRDLVVDRDKIFKDLARVKAWIHLDGAFELGPGPRMGPEVWEWRYPISQCMSCGCCMEACPNYGPGREFVGAAVLNQVRLFNGHPSGAHFKSERLESLLGRGGISDCGNAQNCAAVCPKKIPLTEGIAHVGRQTTLHAVKNWLLG